MTNPDDLILTMKGISKTFPGVQALENVDFSLEARRDSRPGGREWRRKIHPDQGADRRGAPGQRHDRIGRASWSRSALPSIPRRLGISTVYQEVNLCTNISVAENIMLGHEPRRFGSIDWQKMNAQARQALKRLSIDIDVTQPLGNYSVAIQQMVAIARSLEISSAKILILDEPTSSLDANETNLLFDVMRKLKAEGIGIIFITHFLDQVYRVADRITVLRNGKLVGTYDTASLPRVELIAKMLDAA